jgi:hypothetical protein
MKADVDHVTQEVADTDAQLSGSALCDDDVLLWESDADRLAIRSTIGRALHNSPGHKLLVPRIFAVINYVFC